MLPNHFAHRRSAPHTRSLCPVVSTPGVRGEHPIFPMQGFTWFGPGKSTNEMEVKAGKTKQSYWRGAWCEGKSAEILDVISFRLFLAHFRETTLTS